MSVVEAADGTQLVYIPGALLGNIAYALGHGEFKLLSTPVIQTFVNGLQAAQNGYYTPGEELPEIHPGIPWPGDDPAAAREKAVKLVDELLGVFDCAAWVVGSTNPEWARTNRRGVEAIAEHLGLIA